MESWKIFVEEEKAWEAEDPEEENYSGRHEPPWMNTKIEDAVKVVLASMDLLKDKYEIQHSSNLSYEEFPDPETAKEYVGNLGSTEPGHEREELIRSSRDAVGIIIEIIVHLYHNNELTLDFSEDNYKAIDDLLGMSRGDKMNYENSPEVLSQFKGVNKYLDQKIGQGTH